MYSILDKYGNKRCDVNSLEYRGEFMSVSSVVVTIKSSTPIEFANGDYIVFRGEEFTLRYTPAVLKQARKDTYGEAFVYENIVFYAASDELTRCDFLDIVKSDNKIHYTSLPNFSFYAESVQELADRIQANLNRLYTGKKAWTISVANGTVSKAHNFSCSNLKCWDALVLANTELDLNFVIRGRKIVIGSVGTAIDHEFTYGINKGLKNITSSTSENSAIITRLRAYGSTRNIPYRYYNKLYKNSSGVVKYFKDKPGSGWTLLISESMYMPNLMLPMFRDSSLIGTKGDLYDEDGVLCGEYRLGGTIGKDAYIESVKGVEKYGVNEGTVFFDTEDEEDEDSIYPSMSGITAQDLIDAGYSIQLDSGDNGNLDEILSADTMTDEGYLPENGSSINPSSFTVTLKDIGFDIQDYLSDENAQIYFSSGELVGRTFEITGITKNSKKQILRLNRYLDEDIQWVFPNKYYNAKPGDKFVLLNIYMPDVYVVAAEHRLLKRAKFYLADNDHNTINYSPAIDNIFLARNPDIAANIKEGDIFTFSDNDLDIYKSITISALNIKVGESLIPEYEVTLSEDKDATLVDRITSEVSDNLGKNLLSSNNIVSLSRLQFDRRYLRKTTEDTAEKKITFNEGLRADGDGVTATKITANKGVISQVTADKITSESIESADYNSGLSGFKLGNVGGYSYLDIDKLSVRKKAIFAELDIKRIDHIGGANVTSPASCRIAKVEPYYPSTTMATAEGEELSAADGDYSVLAANSVGYKCYFQAEQDGEQINNDWRVGDQALCHAYNLATPRYYWRLVIDKSTAIEDGYHWVALSIDDCDTDSDEPMADDTIVCFGNRTDTDRQAVILMNSEGVASPCLQQLKGINSYVIADENIVTQLSPTKNIIRGEQIELSTSSGNYKGVQQLANEALASAKGYTDTKATDAKTYADGVLSSAKSYADSVGTSTLGSAKTYADGKVSSAVNTAKNYIDGKASSTLADAKSYTNTQAADAKSYADGLFADADESLKTTASALESKITINAEGIAARATSEYVEQVKGEVNGQLTTLGTRIETAENSIEVKADKTELKAQKETIDALTTSLNNTITRVSSAESKITQNANQIATKVSQTELTKGLTDANFLAMAISKGKLLYADPTFKEGKNGVEVYNNKAGNAVTITRKQIAGMPNDSGYGLEIVTDKSLGETAYGAGGFCFANRAAANKIFITRFVAKLPTDKIINFATNAIGNSSTTKWLTSNKGTGNWEEYIFYVKCGADGTFMTTNFFFITPNADVTWQLAYATVIDATGCEQFTTLTEFNTEINQLSDQINLRATKTDLQTVSNNVGAVENRLTAAESSLTMQADRISSVVSKQEAMVVDYTFADFIAGEMTWVETSEGFVLGYNNEDTSYHWLRIKNVKKGDVIRFETSDYSGVLVYSITGSDGDADGAEAALIRDQNPIVDQYTWLGKQLFYISHDDEEISETLVPMDCAEVYVYTSDDWSNKGKTKVTHIKAKMTAQSRIDQSADNIRLQVGEAGINLDTKVITLDASKTIVTGDLAVRTVKCYYDDAQTQLKSAYNGNGDGTIVYYYPNGKVMRQDAFVTDSNGNAVGMRTTYYNADGSVSWVLDNSGLKTTLSDYWEALNGAQPMAYTTSYDTMMTTCKEWLDQAMQHFDESTFSRFVSQSGNYKSYNGKVAKGLKSSEAPTAVTLFAGVLVYSVELYKDGLLPTYIVTYELVTTAQNQVGAIMTQKFNISGEVS